MKQWQILMGIFFLVVLSIILFNKMDFNGGDVLLGKRIYEDGILADGSLLKAITVGGGVLSGEMASCARCHRKSGFGSFEGNIYVPPITADVLFTDQLRNREDMMRSLYHEEFTLRHWAKIRKLGLRSAYTDESLNLALAQGVSSSNAQLDPIMPKYQLDEKNFKHLAAYLKTLNQEKPIGIDQDTIHFATILTGKGTKEAEAIFKDLIETYVAWKNKNVVAEKKRAAVTPHYKGSFHHTYLHWKVHFWELTGNEDTWSAQLQKYYQQQNVFALLSGLGSGNWQPIHEFSESNELPCIYPNTNFPVNKEEGYTLYFSKGIFGEANSLSNYFRQDKTPVMQFYDKAEPFLTLKKELENTLGKDTSITLKSYNIDEIETIDSIKAQSANIVFWLDEGAIKKLTLPFSLNNNTKLFTYFNAAKVLKEKFPAQSLSYTYPYALPDDKTPRNYRLRAWMRSRGLGLIDEPLQMNTYFALSVTDFAVSHLVGNYSRDYLIERIEHETENNLNPGVFPNLSLGPGQRFASEGNYLLRLIDSKKYSLGYY